MGLWKRGRRDDPGHQPGVHADREVLVSAACTRVRGCDIFGLTVTEPTPDRGVNRCREAVEEQQALMIGVLNAAKVIDHGDDEHRHQALVTRDPSAADGVSVAVAGPLVARRLSEWAAGTEICADVLAHAEEQGLTVHLLAANASCLADLGEALRVSHPDLRVVGQHEGGCLSEPDALEEIAEALQSSTPDLVLAGMLASARCYPQRTPTTLQGKPVKLRR